MIQTENLTFEYSSSLSISFPDLSVEAGHSILISGESGCGKTTLLHLLAGLRRPTKGKILIDGSNIADYSANSMDRFRGENMGIVYQQPYFIESLSILDNLLISPYTLSKDKAKVVSNRLEIKHLLFRYPYQLSVGQQQRANIARAVMNNPKLLLVDEPTSALDNKNCSYVIDLLLEEACTNGAALIVVSHDDRLRTEITNCVELTPISH